MTPGRRFYEQQLVYLKNKDLDGLMGQYHEDAVLIGFDFQITGRVALRAHFENYFKKLGFIDVVSTDKFTETSDSIFFEATVKTQLGTVRVYDVFMLKEGKTTHQFTGSFPT